MLTHDTTAFVEKIAVPKPDRRADKLRRQAGAAELQVAHVSIELRLAEDALKRIEERSDRESPRSSLKFGLLRRSWAAERDNHDRMVADLRDRLTAARARAQNLARRVQEHEPTRTQNTWYRLHSAEHHGTYSEPEFETMSAKQRIRPVLVTSVGGLTWWWYLDRFWWDDQSLPAREIASTVLEFDGHAVRHRNAERRALALTSGETPPALTVAELAIPDVVRQIVWQRDGGRCAHCGGTTISDSTSSLPFPGAAPWTSRTSSYSAVPAVQTVGANASR